MPKEILQIKKNDLYDLAVLLGKGYSVQSALDIIGGYELIQKKLKQGESFEEFLDVHKQNDFNKALRFFRNVAPLDIAVKSAYEYEQSKKNNRGEWIRQTAYPLFVLLFAFAVFILFEIMIYPQLSVMMESENSFTHRFLFMIVMILLVLGVLTAAGTIALCLLKYFKRERFYEWYERFFSKSKLLKKLVSYDYALFSLILMKQGLSTKQVFESLLTLKCNQLLSYDLRNMIREFQCGHEMIDIILHQPHFDETFKQFFKIGYYSLTLNDAMQDYCDYQQNEFKALLKKGSVLIAGAAYLFIAVLVVSIYQLMLMPLDMIHQF